MSPSISHHVMTIMLMILNSIATFAKFTRYKLCIARSHFVSLQTCVHGNEEKFLS